MNLPCTRRVEPVRQSPRTKMYGYFTIELFHLPALTHLARCLFPTAFAGRLPRLTLVAAYAVTRLSPRFRYFAAVRLLTELRSPFRLRYRPAYSGATRRLGQSS